MERGGIDGVGRFLRGVAALGLAVAAGGAIILVLEAAGPESVSVLAGRAPGEVLLLGADQAGDSPFTAAFAVDLGLDPALLAIAPRSAAAADSPHRRHSDADRLVATLVAPALAAAGPDLTVSQIERVVAESVGLRAVLAELSDADGDDRDDDRRFTLTALDGSSVCVDLGVPRLLARQLGAAVDSDGVPNSGVSWTPFGPCGDSRPPNQGADVRVATTPGTYGGTVAGDVCDVSVLAAALAMDPVLAAAWTAPLDLEPSDLAAYFDTLTPVLLLVDTAVTDHAWRGDRVAARQAILQRGTAILVDPTGVPRVRCMSGAPLRSPQAMPAGVAVLGEPWSGFSLDGIRRIPAGDRAVTSFVLIDVRTGDSLRKPAGIDGILARLAGPIAIPAEG